MNVLLGIWPCQLLEQMRHPPLSWNTSVALYSYCSVQMSDVTAVPANQNEVPLTLTEHQGTAWKFVAYGNLRWVCPKISYKIKGLSLNLAMKL